MVVVKSAGSMVGWYGRASSTGAGFLEMGVGVAVATGGGLVRAGVTVGATAAAVAEAEAGDAEAGGLGDVAAHAATVSATALKPTATPCSPIRAGRPPFGWSIGRASSRGVDGFDRRHAGLPCRPSGCRTRVALESGSSRATSLSRVRRMRHVAR